MGRQAGTRQMGRGQGSRGPLPSICHGQTPPRRISPNPHGGCVTSAALGVLVVVTVLPVTVVVVVGAAPVMVVVIVARVMVAVMVVVVLVIGSGE